MQTATLPHTTSHDWQPDPQGWRDFYEKTGYLVVENAVDPATLSALTQGLEDIENSLNDGSLSPELERFIKFDRDRAKAFASVARDDDSGPTERNTISNIMELPLFAPVFKDLILYPRVLDILEALFGTPEFAFYNYKCICKMPGNKTAFQWHRDLPYLQHTTPNLITCILCVDAMTEENGATVVCPGTHRIPHEEVLPSDIDIPESEIPHPRVTVACPAGSVVLFHTNIIHGGGANISQSKRRNIIGIWRGPDTYPTRMVRLACEDVMPRSQDPMRQKQIAMTFGK